MKYLSGAWSVFVQLGDGVGSLPSVSSVVLSFCNILFFLDGKGEKRRRKRKELSQLVGFAVFT